MGKRPSKMNTTAESLFAKLKGSSSSASSSSLSSPGKDENSKKSKKSKKLPMSPLDMKSVKVLVERTKFNEMHILDASRQKPHLKTVNGATGGGMDKKRGRPVKKKRGPVPNKMKQLNIKKKAINGLFKIRRCYVKLSKDKRLHWLAKQALKSKPTRGRPRKIRETKEIELPVTVEAPTTNGTPSLKRKSTENPDSSLPKRGRNLKHPKGREFFINIGSLVRTPSPRRRGNTPTISPLDGRSPTTANKKPIALKKSPLSGTALRNKFGTRFFRSYVKLHRVRDPFQAENISPQREKKAKKKNGKNLSVSFLETVEIFGESSDDDDYEDTSFCSTGKGSRLKRLENGIADDEKPLSSSTPCGSRNTPERKPSGILKRKEKISFSPLKEDEPSPRKEQLKLANEKIVRLSFEEIIPPSANEEDELVPKNQQSELDKESPNVAPITDVTVDDDSNKISVKVERPSSAIESITSSKPIEPETELMTPPPSSDKDEESIDNALLVPTNQEKEKSLKNAKSSSPIESKSESTEEAFEKSKEENDSFKSAVGESLSLEIKTAEDSHSNVVAENVNDATEESTETNPNETQVQALEENPTVLEATNDEIPQTTNQVNIETPSDQHFVDASELVATALLDDEERNEADAVLNDVCQIAAAESAALLSEDGSCGSDHLGGGGGGEVTEYDSRPSDVIDDDDDFTSVLTHPEVERSLQSAASTLVPNSQEIVVAAAAAASSQGVNDIDVNEDTFASVVAEVERLTKDVNPEIYSDDVGITGDDVMMDNVQANNSLDDIFDDDDDDDIISSLRMSSGNIDIGHDKSLPIQVIETEVMAIPNEPDLIFDKPLGTTASLLGTSMASTNDTLAGHGHCSTTDSNSKLTLGRLFQSVKSYMMAPAGEKNAALQD